MQRCGFLASITHVGVFFYSLSKFITKLDETLDCEHAAIMSGVGVIAFVVKGSTWVCVCVCVGVGVILSFADWM